MIINKKMQTRIPMLASSEAEVENHFSNLQPQTEFAISIIVPTRNESGNVEPLLTRIDEATRGVPIEVVFVDDSTDNTPEVITSLQNRFSLSVVLIARPPECRSNGLGGAVVEGFKAARSPWVCVMDGDLQHPPEMILELYKKAEKTGADLVVGSRLAPGGDASSLGSKRFLVSHALAMATRATFPVRLRNVTDPLSGFFMVRRAALNLDALRPDGFKILLEILARSPKLSVAEVPIQFGHRHAGESKASIREVMRLMRLLLRLRMATDKRFVQFITVGVTGIVVNSLALAFVTERLGIYYLVSVVIATVVSTAWNYILTELWVYRDRQQAGNVLGRFSLFLAMSIVSLLLRGPLVYFLTSIIHMYYILSNLLSLVTMTILRFMFADKYIFRETESSTNSYKSKNLSDNFQTNKAIDY